LSKKNVCQHWISLLDRNFEVQIHKKKIKNAINWTSKQSDCKELFSECEKAMVWLEKNLDKFEIIPELPKPIYSEKELVDYANAYFMHNTLPRNYELDDDLEWSNDMVGRLYDDMCFGFFKMDDILFFLNEMNLLDIEPSANFIDNQNS